MNKVAIKSSKGFYIGDICYVLNKDLYYGVWGAADYKDGKYADPKTGAEFAVAGTAYGDGLYLDNHGNCYLVDAGVIGLVPLELVEEEDYNTDLGHFEEIPGEATFEAHGGRFTVTLPDDKVILIDTTDDGAEDDDDDYWGDDEAQDDYETMDPEDFLDKYL